MHLARITLENVRSFRRLDLDLTRDDGSLAGWTVVAARNGSGKTTLLSAIALGLTNRYSVFTIDDDGTGGWGTGPCPFAAGDWRKNVHRRARQARRRARACAVRAATRTCTLCGRAPADEASRRPAKDAPAAL